MRRKGVTQRPTWFETVRAGDVLGTPSGLRLVRRVSRRGSTLWVWFAIRHCSWTRRPYTLYSANDTYLRRCVWVGRAKVKPTELDRRIEKEICQVGAWEHYASCTEVRGIP